MNVLSKTIEKLGLSKDASEKPKSVNFESFAFDPKLQESIKNVGFSSATPIQAQAIPQVLEGKDLIGCAQTGTGKTAAFALPAIHKLLEDKKKGPAKGPKVLVLTPTRELAIQIQETFHSFCKSLRLSSVSIIGGVSMGSQLRQLRRKYSPEIIVATPGRLLDIMKQRAINLNHIHTLILDEADRMLDMGFIPDTKQIVKALSHERQTLMFSATMSEEVKELSQELMTDTPAFVKVAAKKVSAEGIDQTLYPVKQDQKRSLLFHLLENKEMNRVIVFTRTKFGASKLSDALDKEGIRSRAIHSGKSQAQRQAVWTRFRSGRLRVLVATDLASRGIDVENVSHVVNFDLPDCPETYIHRIGRTGRASRKGKAFSFCSPDQKRLLDPIEKHLKKDLAVCDDHPFFIELPKKRERGGAPSSRSRRGRGPSQGRGRKPSWKNNRKRDSRPPRQF